MNNPIGNKSFDVRNIFTTVSSQLEKLPLIDFNSNNSFDLKNLVAPSFLFSSKVSLSKTGTSPTLKNIFDADTSKNTSTSTVKSTKATDALKGKVMGTAEGTGYYPHSSRLEGGYVDTRGKKLNTLQDFLDGKASYVSIALDKNLYRKGTIKYGDKFRIPELEKKYGRKIEFRAVDTGGAFTNKKFNRVDICTRSEKYSLDKTINGKLTLIKTS